MSHGGGAQQASSLVCGGRCCGSASAAPASAQPEQLDTIKDVFAQTAYLLEAAAGRRSANPIDITVIVSFNREGAILGHPRITYESEQRQRQ